jgi:hypothetical protein
MIIVYVAVVLDFVLCGALAIWPEFFEGNE